MLGIALAHKLTLVVHQMLQAILKRFRQLAACDLVGNRVLLLILGTSQLFHQ